MRAFFPALVIAIVGPLLVLIFPSIPFGNDGNCDPWYIFGAFYLQPDLLHWYPSSRVVGRLPEILPGYFFTHVLRGVAADYGLFFAYYLTSLVCLYKIVQRLVAREVALAATVLFATHPLIVANYSGTLDTPPLVYDIVSLYFVARAIDARRGSRKLLLMFGSGIFLGAALHGHLGIIAFAFANYLIYVICEFRGTQSLAEKVGSILAACLATLAGVLIITVLLGAINVLLFHGTFLQILNQLGAIATVNSSNANGFWRAQWYLRGEPAGFFLFGALVALLNLAGPWLKADAIRERGPEFVFRLRTNSIATLTIAVLLFAYNQLGGVFMQYEYYYVFFLPYLIIAACYPLLLCVEARWLSRILFALVLLAASIAALRLGPDIWPWLYKTPNGPIAAMALGVIAALFYAVALASKRFAFQWVLLYLGAAVLLSAVIRPVQMGADIWANRSSVDREAYARLRQGLEFLSGLHFSRPPKFWTDVANGPWEVIAYQRSFKLCGIHEFPAAAADDFEPFLQGDDVVVISAAKDLPDRASAAFAARGVKINETAQSTVNGSGQQYQILVARVTQGAEGSKPPETSAAPAPPASAMAIDDVFAPSADAMLPEAGREGQVLEIPTPEQPWGYGEVFPVKRQDLEGPLWVRLDARAVGGPVGIGLLNSQATGFIDRAAVQPSARDAEIILHVGNGVRLGNLVFQSWSEGRSATLRLKRIAVLKPNSLP